MKAIEENEILGKIRDVLAPFEKKGNIQIVFKGFGYGRLSNDKYIQGRCWVISNGLEWVVINAQLEMVELCQAGSTRLGGILADALKVSGMFCKVLKSGQVQLTDADAFEGCGVWCKKCNKYIHRFGFDVSHETDFIRNTIVEKIVDHKKSHCDFGELPAIHTINRGTVVVDKEATKYIHSFVKEALK